MQLARWLVLLVVAQLSHANPLTALTPRASQSLERERLLLDEAQAAIAASDTARARAKLTEVVDALLVLADAQRDEAWLALVEAAARSARQVRDARTRERAWSAVLDRRLATQPDDHADLQRARAGLAHVLNDLGELDRAHDLFVKVLEIRSRTLPPDHHDLVLAILDVGLTSNKRGDLRGARERFEQALEICERTLSEGHPNLQLARRNLGTTILMLGDHRGALSLFEQVLAVAERTLPAEHPDLRAARMNVAGALARLGDLRGALDVEQKVFDECSRAVPDDHPELQAVRRSLASTLYKLGDISRARSLCEDVLEVSLRTLPEDHPEVQIARTNLAAVLIEFADFRGARALQERALELSLRKFPEDHPNIQLARSGLATTLHRLGDLEGARRLFEQTLEVRLRTLPEQHPDVQLSRNNLGSTLRILGDLSGSRVLFEQALAIESRALPDDHPSLQITRQNLATTLGSLGNLGGARALEEKVLEVRLRTQADDHPEVQGARQNLAVTLRDLGDLHGARVLEEQVLEVCKRTLQDDHFTLQRARQNLAVTLKSLGELDAARALEEKVLEVHARALPDGHPDLQMARINLAETMISLAERASGTSGDPDDAHRDAARTRAAELLGAFARANTGSARHIVLSAPSREAEERCARLARALDGELSLVLGFRSLPPMRELAPEAFAFSEIARGAAIASSTLARRARSSPQYAERRASLQGASAELAVLARKGTTGADFEAARQRREAAERALVESTRELPGSVTRGWSIDVDAVADVLGEGRAVIAFRRFERSRADALSTNQPARTAAGGTSLSLCAFVVWRVESSGRHEASVAVLDLGPLAPIERAVGAWRGALGAAEGRGVGAQASPASTDLAACGDAVRRLVLDPLTEVLGDARHLIVVADDVLHLVPFDALPVDATGSALVGDLLQIEIRSTLTELLDAGAEIADSLSFVCVGDVRFDVAQSEPGAGESSPVAVANDARVPGLLRSGAWSAGFTPLPGTRGEIDGLERLFREASDAEGSVTRLDGAGASRTALVDLAPRARFLHVATHGWFAPESIPSWDDPEPLDWHSGLGMRMSGEEQVKGMSPMLLCGLALAGANSPEDAVGRAPGLITAEEISTLDLSNCELVVLSACDTNVGERRAGQGVASLQKALQMAGARSVITSLWKVPDEATKELMLDFYRRLWVEKKPKHQALWEAKTRLREERDARGELKYTTRDWAAWVLTGQPD